MSQRDQYMYQVDCLWVPHSAASFRFSRKLRPHGGENCFSLESFFSWMWLKPNQASTKWCECRRETADVLSGQFGQFPNAPKLIAATRGNKNRAQYDIIMWNFHILTRSFSRYKPIIITLKPETVALLPDEFHVIMWYWEDFQKPWRNLTELNDWTQRSIISKFCVDVSSPTSLLKKRKKNNYSHFIELSMSSHFLSSDIYYEGLKNSLMSENQHNKWSHKVIVSHIIMMW